MPGSRKARLLQLPGGHSSSRCASACLPVPLESLCCVLAASCARAGPWQGLGPPGSVAHAGSSCSLPCAWPDLLGGPGPAFVLGESFLKEVAVCCAPGDLSGVLVPPELCHGPEHGGRAVPGGTTGHAISSCFRHSLVSFEWD